jgi:hypothetical protein
MVRMLVLVYDPGVRLIVSELLPVMATVTFSVSRIVRNVLGSAHEASSTASMLWRVAPSKTVKSPSWTFCVAELLLKWIVSTLVIIGRLFFVL